MTETGALEFKPSNLIEWSVLFKCEVCEYTSPSKQDISVHKSQQHNERDPEEKCDEKSNQSTLQDTSNVLNNAEVRNTNIAFTCTVCEYKCENKRSIRNHMIVEHKKCHPSDTMNYCTNLINHSKALKIGICIGVCKFMTS